MLKLSCPSLRSPWSISLTHFWAVVLFKKSVYSRGWSYQVRTYGTLDIRPIRHAFFAFSDWIQTWNLRYITVAQTASFSDIFVQNGKFWHISAKFEKMCLNMAKKAFMPQVYSHNKSFEPNLSTIFKYLLSKPVHQNSLVGPFFGLKNRLTSGFF